MTSRYTAKDEWDPAGFQTYRSYLSFQTSCLPCSSPVLTAIGDILSSSEDQQVILLFACEMTEMIQTINLSSVLLPGNSNFNCRISYRPLSSIIWDLA